MLILETLLLFTAILFGGGSIVWLRASVQKYRDAKQLQENKPKMRVTRRFANATKRSKRKNKPNTRATRQSHARDWWKTGVNDIGAPRPDTISPIPEGIALLEAERAREREPGDGSPQKSVVEQIEAALA